MRRRNRSITLALDGVPFMQVITSVVDSLVRIQNPAMSCSPAREPGTRLSGDIVNTVRLVHPCHRQLGLHGKHWSLRS